jgi:hypothetical protein
MSEDEKVVVISHRELTPMEELDQWLKELVFPGKVEDFIEEISDSLISVEHSRKLCFYTENHCYFIHATHRKDHDNSYIGCQVNARKSRPGEDWMRGNDLPNGPFNKQTWNKIIYAIVNYELVKLSPFQKPDNIPDELA